LAQVDGGVKKLITSKLKICEFVMFALLAVACLSSIPALRVQHEDKHASLTNQSSLTLEQREKLQTEWKECTTVKPGSSGAFTKYGSVPKVTIANLAFPCPLQTFQTQAPFYMDIAAQNQIKDRAWWMTEFPVERTHDDDLGLGISTNYGKKIKSVLNTKFGKTNREFKDMDTYGPGLVREIALNAYQDYLLKLNLDVGRSEYPAAVYESCKYREALGALKPYEYLQCLAAASPRHGLPHRSVAGEYRTNPGATDALYGNR